MGRATALPLTFEKQVKNNNMKTTKYGIEYQLTDVINERWMGYHKKVAESHLTNYGVVIADEYGNPIDNQFDIDQILDENPQLLTRKGA